MHRAADANHQTAGGRVPDYITNKKIVRERVCKVSSYRDPEAVARGALSSVLALLLIEATQLFWRQRRSLGGDCSLG
jgi:hypothetical protein